MALTTVYILVDSSTIAIDAEHITIEGADVLVQAIKNRPIHINDYLGIGTPLYKR